MHNDKATLERLRVASELDSYAGCLDKTATIQHCLSAATFAPVSNHNGSQATRTFLAAAEYDVLLRDALYWPAAILDDLLGIPSVEVLSAAPFQPFFGPMWSIPDPVAYLPQLGSGLSPNMVQWFFFLKTALITRKAVLVLVGPHSEVQL